MENPFKFFYRWSILLLPAEEPRSRETKLDIGSSKPCFHSGASR